jgi:PAS domain S-box-containing protein
METKRKAQWFAVGRRLARTRLKWLLVLRGKKATLGFVAALVLLAAIAATVYVQTRLLLDSTTWVFRTHSVLFSQEKLLSEAEQVESCHRQYVAHRSQSYLNCVQESRQRIFQELRNLSENADQPTDQKAIARLGTIIAARLDVLREDSPSQYPTAPFPILQTSQSEQAGELPDLIRVQIEAMEKEQQGLLAERVHTREQATKRTMWALGCCFLFSGTVLSIVFTHLNREVGKRINAQYYLRVAYAAIDEAHRHLNGVIESTPDCIAAVDQQLQWIAFNSGYRQDFQERYGVTPETGISIDECLTQRPDELEKMIAVWRRALAGEAFTVTEERPNSGTERTYEDRYYPIPDHAGTPIAACHIARDISERKRFENILLRQSEELRRSNAELEQFAYAASHDLQEPLRMVASYMQLFAERYQGRLDEKADKYIGYAVDGARRMQTLINDLLSLSRVNSRGGEFKPTDCKTVVGRVLHDLDARIRDTSALVEAGDLPTVIADDQQLGQLFQNLLCNALKFHGDDKPHVRITAEQQSDHWLFTVQDNGIGIAPQHAEQIFVLFQRLHSRHKYEGTGIGLAICKKIVERHGGRIWVESEVGKGASFKFTLPLTQPMTTHTTWQKAEAARA